VCAVPPVCRGLSLDLEFLRSMTSLVRSSTWYSIGLLVAACCLIECSLTPRFELAESANAEFQSRVRLKRYAEIYAASAPAFRKTTTLAELAKLLDVINRKLGTCEVGPPGIRTAKWGSQGSEVTVNYTLHCASGQLYESICWQVVDGKLLLTNFAVSSALLSVSVE
jgi:hypothetical protein